MNDTRREPYMALARTQHVHGNNLTLIGTAVTHFNAISLIISPAEEIVRNGRREYRAILSEKPLLEVRFTRLQWAELMTSQGQMEGVPATLSYHAASGEIDPPEAPEHTVIEHSSDLHRQGMQEIEAQLQEALTLLAAMEQRGRIGKGDLRQVREAVSRAHGNLTSHGKLLTEDFTATLERSVAEATDQLRHAATRYGLAEGAPHALSAARSRQALPVPAADGDEQGTS